MTDAYIEALNLEPYQKRVLKEERDLNESIEKLNNFIASLEFTQLPEDEQILLNQQHHAMLDLARILKKRTDKFNG